MGLLSGKKIAFVGGGNMAEAIFSGLIAAGAVNPCDLCVADISAARLSQLAERYGVETRQNSGDNAALPALAQGCDIIFLAVKPQYVRGVLEILSPVLLGTQLVISIVGGLTLAQLEEFIEAPVLRVMPNTPVAQREGVAGIAAGRRCGDQHLALGLEIFGLLGRAFVLPESLIDPLTGISGCGPAYAYLFIEALADGGVKLGLPRDLSYQLAAQMLLGSAKMVLESGLHPAALKDSVCSPGGATIAGVHALEKGKFRAAVIDAVETAAARMAEVGRKA